VWKGGRVSEKMGRGGNGAASPALVRLGLVGRLVLMR